MEDKHKKILDRLESQCARREYCSSDMLKKAAELLDGDMEAAQEILGKLIAGGFVDDRRYAAAFAREKSGITGWGPLKIRFALGTRHIPADIIAEAVSEIDGDRAGQKLRRLMRAELEKNIPCPNLGPFSARQLDLICFAYLIQNIARSEFT